MKINELYALLDIESTDDMRYHEPFCTLMETEEKIPEESFYVLFRSVPLDKLKELFNDYLEEVISGIADDCIEFYSFFSSFKRSVSGLANFCIQEEKSNLMISELFKFREWYNEKYKVICHDIDDNVDMRLSICEALTYGRMERLSMANFSFDYSDAMDFEYYEYEEYQDDYDLSEEYPELDEDDSDITLVDKDNPVIDDEMYDEGIDF